MSVHTSKNNFNCKLIIMFCKNMLICEGNDNEWMSWILTDVESFNLFEFVDFLKIGNPWNTKESCFAQIYNIKVL